VLRRLASILLLVTFAFVGTGALRYLHDLGHLREDAAAAARDENGRKLPAPLHTEWNCELHALLAAPLIVTSAIPLLILLGLLVAFLTQLAPQPVSARTALRLDCRGPPTC
jgi:hypothetical protein